jgi:hypothetical protein
MNEHDKIRELLGAGRSRRADERGRKAGCGACAVLHACSNELEAWRPIASELRRLPTPQPSSWLVQATLARAEAKFTEQAEHDWNHRLMIIVVAFAWLLTIASWAVFHVVSGRFERLLGPQFSHPWISFAAFTALEVARGRGGRSDAGNPAARRKEAG